MAGSVHSCCIDDMVHKEHPGKKTKELIYKITLNKQL